MFPTTLCTILMVVVYIATIPLAIGTYKDIKETVEMWKEEEDEES